MGLRTFTDSLRIPRLRSRASEIWLTLPAGLASALAWTWILAGGFGLALKLQRIWIQGPRLEIFRKLGLIVPELGFACGMF